MKYQFMQQQQAHFSLSLMCRVLQVTRSAYYAWLKRAPGARAQQDQQVIQQIEAIHEQSRRT